jgi:hypothetical protein
MAVPPILVRYSQAKKALPSFGIMARFGEVVASG